MKWLSRAAGAGIIISTDGYIVTNQHVIDGAQEVSIILNTGDEITAQIIGQDVKNRPCCIENRYR